MCIPLACKEQYSVVPFCLCKVAPKKKSVLYKPNGNNSLLLDKIEFGGHGTLILGKFRLSWEGQIE